MIRSGHALVLALALVVCGAAPSSAQLTQDQVKSALARYQYPKTNAILVRGFYTGEEIRYTTIGVPAPLPPSGLWTVDGWMRVRKVKIKNGILTLESRRLLATFQDKQIAFVGPDDRSVRYIVPLPADETALRGVLDTMFFRADEPIASGLPPIWAEYFANRDKLQQPATPPKPAETSGNPYRVGGGVTAPKALSAPDPSYSNAARHAKLQGTIVLWLIVGPDGKSHDIRLVRPLGMGLDEAAVASVSTWTFQPAMKDGKPVPVQINVEVNFRLY